MSKRYQILGLGLMLMGSVAAMVAADNAATYIAMQDPASRARALSQSTQDFLSPDTRPTCFRRALNRVATACRTIPPMARKIPSVAFSVAAGSVSLAASVIILVKKYGNQELATKEVRSGIFYADATATTTLNSCAAAATMHEAYTRFKNLRPWLKELSYLEALALVFNTSANIIGQVAAASALHEWCTGKPLIDNDDFVTFVAWLSIGLNATALSSLIAARIVACKKAAAAPPGAEVITEGQQAYAKLLLGNS